MEDIITVITNNTILNTIIFTFDTTIDGATTVTVTLSPNVMEEGSIGGGVVISGLMPDTLYTYTVLFVYKNITYSAQSSAITSTGTNIVISSTMATASSVPGMDNPITIKLPFTTTHSSIVQTIVSSNACLHYMVCVCAESMPIILIVI